MLLNIRVKRTYSNTKKKHSDIMTFINYRYISVARVENLFVELVSDVEGV